MKRPSERKRRIPLSDTGMFRFAQHDGIFITFSVARMRSMSNSRNNVVR